MSEPYLSRAGLYERLDAVRTALGVSPAEPADPFRLSALTGCRVGLRPFDGNVGGMLLYLPDGPLVLLNAARPCESRRFSLAHELVHLWLHPKRPPGQPQDPCREWQANDGAAELLIPYRALAPLVVRNRVLLREDPALLARIVAQRFEVSQTQAKYRLRALYGAGAPERRPHADV